MPFEVFTKRMAREGSKPYVTIQKKGIIAFNHAAYAALGQPQAIVFLFDGENQLVGFRAADPDDEHAYAVRPNTKRTSHLVSGTLFTRHYGISTNIARRWLGRMGEQEVLTIDLKESPLDAPSATTTRQPRAHRRGLPDKEV
jgi:hypothetical protein